METAEHREPYESRGSRTDLGAPGGESPPGDSTSRAAKVPLWVQRGDLRRNACQRAPRADFRHRGSRRSPWARLNSFDFGPRLGDGQELSSVLLWPDFLVAQAIRQPLDEAPLPDGSLRHAGEGG